MPVAREKILSNLPSILGKEKIVLTHTTLPVVHELILGDIYSKDISPVAVNGKKDLIQKIGNKKSEIVSVTKEIKKKNEIDLKIVKSLNHNALGVIGSNISKSISSHNNDNDNGNNDNNSSSSETSHIDNKIIQKNDNKMIQKNDNKNKNKDETVHKKEIVNRKEIVEFQKKIDQSNLVNHELQKTEEKKTQNLLAKDLKLKMIGKKNDKNILSKSVKKDVIISKFKVENTKIEKIVEEEIKNEEEENHNSNKYGKGNGNGSKNEVKEKKEILSLESQNHEADDNKKEKEIMMTKKLVLHEKDKKNSLPSSLPLPIIKKDKPLIK